MFIAGDWTWDGECQQRGGFDTKEVYIIDYAFLGAYNIASSRTCWVKSTFKGSDALSARWPFRRHRACASVICIVFGNEEGACKLVWWQDSNDIVSVQATLVCSAAYPSLQTTSTETRLPS
jgi:hypothetical protein